MSLELRRCNRAGFAVWLAAVAMCGSLLSGCNDNKNLAPDEILPRASLVDLYNSRAEAIQKLKAKCHVEARMPRMDDQGRPVQGKYDTWSLDGNLLLRKPRDLYLVGRALSDPMFGLHSNRETYWFWVKPRASVEYVGRYDGAGAEQFLIRPDYLLRTLGIFPVPADLWAFRRGDRRDVLQLMAVEVPDAPPGAGRQVKVMLYLVQEVYLERVHHDPVEVRLYDKRGERIVVSHLEDYQVVDGQRVPTRLTCHFVPADATFKLSLSKVSLTAEIKDAVFDHDTVTPPSLKNHINLDAPQTTGDTGPAPGQ